MSKARFDYYTPTAFPAKEKGHLWLSTTEENKFSTEAWHVNTTEVASWDPAPQSHQVVDVYNINVTGKPVQERFAYTLEYNFRYREQVTSTAYVLLELAAMYSYAEFHDDPKDKSKVPRPINPLVSVKWKPLRAVEEATPMVLAPFQRAWPDYAVHAVNTFLLRAVRQAPEFTIILEFDLACTPMKEMLAGWSIRPQLFFRFSIESEFTRSSAMASDDWEVV